MSSDPPAWNAAALGEALTGTPFASRVHHLPAVSSTNTLALEAAQSGANSHSVWIADEQTAGRGRGGHQWHSPPATGLYTSILLRPSILAAEALWLSLATGLAVQSAIAQTTGCAPDIRWPNDLLLNGKKFGGILVETSTRPATTTLRHAVIGIGLNIAQPEFPPDLRDVATSLLIESGLLYPREIILAAILKALDREITQLEAERSSPMPTNTLLTRFAAASTWVHGKSVRVGEDHGYTGVTAGLDPRGFLLVQADDGTLRTVHSGGVRPR